MAQSSFTAIAERVDVDPGRDCVMAVFNDAVSTSGKLLGIKAVRIVYSSPFGDDVSSIYGLQGKFSLDRISAYSGGTEASSVKQDTGAGTLSSSIKLMTFPTSVTESGGRIRAAGDAPAGMLITGTVNFQSMLRAPGICDANEGGRCIEGHNIIHKMWDSDTEPIMLHEGEGLACIQRVFGVPRAMHWNILIRVVSTGYTYRYAIEDSGTPYTVDSPIWCLFNTSGSGINIEIYVISLVGFGEYNLPRFRMIRTGADPDTVGGETVSIVKRDTAATIGDVIVKKGPIVAYPLAGNHGVTMNYLDYQGTPILAMIQQKADLFRNFMIVSPQYTVTTTPSLRLENETERWPGDRRGAGAIDDDIIINPGEGFAIVGGIQNQSGTYPPEASEMCLVNVEIDCYQSTPSAVYPSEDDVRNGVDYGPTGADYDGDLILPAEADVKDGVFYGADGTEYEGEYAGGGGSGMSKGRVVNQ